MSRAAAFLAIVLAAGSAGCPAHRSAAIPEAAPPAPPPFRAGGTGEALEEPPPPAPGQYGRDYLETLYPALRTGWASFLADCQLRLPPSDPLNDPSRLVALEFRVARDGTVHELAVAQSSGSSDFDAAALEVVRDAGRFPPPPAALVSDDDTVHILWRFARDRRQAGVATAVLTRVVWPAAMAVPKFVAAGNLTAAARRLAEAAGAPPDPEAGAHTDLVGLGKQIAAAAIVEGLAAEAVETRRAAARAAGRAHLTGAVPALLSLLEGTVDGEVRLAAIDALGRLDDRAAVAPLLAVLRSDTRDGTGTARRIAAAHALTALGAGDQARAAVAGELATTVPAERMGALAVMAGFAIPSAVPELAAMVTDNDQSRPVREAACAALGAAAAAPDALKALRKGLDARDATVRAACAQGIAVAATAGHSAGRVAFWKLVSLIKDRDDRVRAAATLAAARVDPKRFAKELYQLKREKSPAVHAALAEALAVVPGPVAYRRLVDLAADPELEVRRRAAAALIGRPEKQGRELVAKMAGDPDREIQILAIRALDNTAEVMPYLAADSARLRAAALTRLVAARGQDDTLVDAFQRIADAAPGSLDRVLLAAAWLNP